MRHSEGSPKHSVTDFPVALGPDIISVYVYQWHDDCKLNSPL